ncbi:MAG TPA: DUF1631 domain-containing protein [Gammaproteobacteria bacterium]|nr:DUF1631 domain-containing protein [Gammaproteobacteria bacterium]
MECYDMAIAPQFQKLLDSCLEMEFSHLRPLVDRMFENADVALLDFAEKAENNMAQSLFFEAMTEVRKKRTAIEQQFFSELKRGFTAFPCQPEQQESATADNGNISGLSLVDTEELETAVATQNAASKLSSRIMDRIFALKQRLTVVNSGEAIQENEIPGGPAWLGHAYQHAVDELELENRIRLVFIALFDKYVLSHVDTLYDEFNKRLIQEGILPNLKYEVRKQPGGIEIVEQFVPDDAMADQEANTGTEVDGEADTQTPSELGDELFGRICELMAVRRSGGAPAAAGGASNVSPIRTGGGYTGSAQAGGGAAGGDDGYTGANGSSGGTGAAGTTLVSQISNLQSQAGSGSASLSSSEFIENIEIDQGLIDRLQNTLAEEREKIFGAVDRRKLPAADTNVIELVGMLFEFMLKEQDLPNVVKALLSRLHTPLLKVAVVDRNFFTHTHHAARRLLNDMTSAGIRWVEESQIDRGIFPKMKEIVDRVLLDFKEDVSIFDTLLEEFTQAVNELDRRADLVEQRTTEAANGQEKLQEARNRAQQQVRALYRGKAIPEATREFLQRIWADKLTFILLRSNQQEEGKDWQEATAFAARVVESVLPPTSENEQSQRRSALESLQNEVREVTQTLQQADKEKLINTLFETQAQVLESIVAAEAQPVAEAPQEDIAEEAVAASDADEKESSVTPEQQAQIDRLKSIPFGTWFEFEQPGQPKKRAKLSWRSTVTGKFMFVDQLGVKASVISMRDLADCMLAGQVHIIKAEKKPFVDRALNAIHRMLDRAA